MSGEFRASDRQWQRLAPLLPNKPRGVPRVDDRRVVGGIVRVLRSGCHRRIAARRDKPAIGVLAAVHLAATAGYLLQVRRRGTEAHAPSGRG